ncbi:MAG: NERD domain-containing protein [Bacillota bacterium]|nr:NERD domain-containing protein [Bacillota bacterium]
MPVYPSKLPASLREDPLRTSELKLYDYFKENLPSDHVAIYNTEWICNFRKQNFEELFDPFTLSKANPKYSPVGEVDFILVSPLGLLVLELKGGEVFIEEGTWYSKDKDEKVHTIENPLTQARRNMFAVISTLQHCRRFHNRFIPVGYAAILPGTLKWDEEIVDQRLILFKEHSEDLLLWRLKELMMYWWHLWGDHGKCIEKLKQEDIELIISTFAPTVELKKQPNRSPVEEFQKQVLILTENQFDILKCLGGNPKALITGGAGTGKTLLAMEKARQVAGHGHRTLFTCPNRLLAKHVKSQLQDVDNLEVMNFHGLCYNWAVKAGIEGLIDPDGPDRHHVPFGYYKGVLPEALVDAADILEERFEAVIVDEAQEMEDIYWTALQCCLVEEEPIFYIFCDPDQAIWHMESCLPVNNPTFHLNKNLRNSKKVFRILKQLSGETDYETGCVHEGEFEIFKLGYKDDLIKKLGQLLSELISRGYSKKDIAIVTGRSLDTSVLAGLEAVNGFELTSDLYDTADRVLFSSTRQFRGMEAMVVIMIEVEYIVELSKLRDELGTRFRYRDDEDILSKIARETLLIGVSRAQHSLFIITDKKTINQLKKMGIQQE